MICIAPGTPYKNRVSTRPSLSFRVRYEGKVQTFDRRPLKEKEAEQARTSIRYMVAHSLSPFRKKLAKLEAPTPEIPAANPVKKKKRRARKSATSAAVPGK
jgi:hypothetical protein